MGHRQANSPFGSPHGLADVSDVAHALSERSERGAWQARNVVGQGAGATAPLVLDGQRSVTRWCESGWNGWPCRKRTCLVCGPKRRRLTARCLMIDARVDAPTHAFTLTTRDPDTPGEVYRLASAAVWKRLRRQYGPIRYFGAIEFTTGLRAADKRRRQHGHYLVKGLPADADVRAVERLVRETWQATTTNLGYGAWVVEVAELRVPGAAIHYLNLHHSKAYQRPPDGWRGTVERASQGATRYWHRPIGEIREIARVELHAEALTWATGLDAGDALFLAEQAALERAAKRLELREALAASREVAASLVADDRQRRMDAHDERVVLLRDRQQGLWDACGTDENAVGVV